MADPTLFADPSVASGAGFLAGFFAVMMALLFVFVIFIVLFYIYMALALQTIANKTKTENGWLAWIPIANVYLMLKIAKIDPRWMWSILVVIGTLILTFIPFIGFLFGLLYFIEVMAFCVGIYYVWWRICEERGYPGWWSLLQLIPIFGIAVPGIIAWRDNK